MMGDRNWDSCKELLKILGILPVTAQYIYTMTTFNFNNKENFKKNSKLHDTKTRNDSNLFQPQSKLSIY